MSAGLTRAAVSVEGEGRQLDKGAAVKSKDTALKYENHKTKTIRLYPEESSMFDFW